MDKYTRSMQAQFKPEKIPCGLSTKDGIPLHDQIKKDAMMTRLAESGTTVVNVEKHEHFGDYVYFDIRDCLLMQSPGNTHVKNYLRTLKRVHAANKNLLSPCLLEIVDYEMWQAERKEAWEKCDKDKTPDNFHPNRPVMNCIYLKLFIDGVQVHKNSTKPSALPVAFSIERIVPYHFEKKMLLFDDGVIPTRYA